MDLSSVKNLRVLVVGDAIMDEYVYVRPVGKAIKENALSSITKNREVFHGGVWAAAEHVRNFVAETAILYGEKVMWNSRMVDDVYFRKLFVTHELRSHVTPPERHDIAGFDCVIVCDFGHGAMTKELIEEVSEKAKFLCVNAQTNATNFGFNVITKYQRADFIVLDEIEARLAVHDNQSPIEKVIEKLDYQNIIVTLGVHGAVGYNGRGFERRPAVADTLVDTMGAGDAFLAITSPFAAIGTPMSDLLRIGNAAGAAKVSILGHRRSVDREHLEQYLV